MNVVIMVSDGYPHQFSANNAKGEYIARGLKANGCRVAMLDGIFGTKGYSVPEFGVSDNGIDYCIIPRIGKYKALFYAIPHVWKYLKNRKVKDEDNHLIMGLFQYPFFFIVWAMAIMLGYKRSVLFHEWHGCLKHNRLWRWEGYLRDMTFGYFVNTIFPISHYLQEKSYHFHRRMMLLPILAAFDREPQKSSQKEHFTYCCGAPYLLRNTMVLDAFCKFHKEQKKERLQLVVSGNAKQLQDVKLLVDSYLLGESVEIRSQISQDELFRIYDESIALLIPMDPDSLQDKARFSQKIAEYVATGRPIVTSSVGEIPFYFVHRESAMIVPFTADDYYNAMKELAMNSDIADNIGICGRSVGLKNFDYITVASKMIPYLR